MKALVFAALVAGVLAAPAISFAQDATAPLTRAEVRADLDIHAPDATAPSHTGVGGVSGGSSQAGAPTTTAGTHSIYFGH